MSCGVRDPHRQAQEGCRGRAWRSWPSLLSINHQPLPGAGVARRASSQSAHGCAATSRRWDIDCSGHEHREPLGRVAGLLSVGETNDSGLPTIARDLFVEHPPIEQGRRHSHATVDPDRPVMPDPPSRSVVTFVVAHLPQGQLVCIAACNRPIVFIQAEPNDYVEVDQGAEQRDDCDR